MKKVLILALTAIMVLSLAAASMAALTVKGDFRYEMINDQTKSSIITDSKGAVTANQPSNQTYDNVDLRIIFDGDISSTASAHLQMRFQPCDQAAKGTYSYIDEFWFLQNYKLGTLKIGTWDYKMFQDRVLLKPNGFYMIPRNDAMVTVNIPITKEFYFGSAYALDAGTQNSLYGSGKDDENNQAEVADGGYDVNFGYKTKQFGGEIHYIDTKSNKSGKLVKAVGYDVFYQLSDNIKLFSFGNDPQNNGDLTNSDPTKRVADDPSFNGCVGATFDKVLGLPLKISPEVGFNKNTWNPTNEFTPYALQVIYTLPNAMTVETEITNQSDHGDFKSLLRLKWKF